MANFVLGPLDGLTTETVRTPELNEGHTLKCLDRINFFVPYPTRKVVYELRTSETLVYVGLDNAKTRGTVE